MSDLDSINYQAWICPACYEDHLQSQGCSKEITRLKSELERVKKIAHELADFYGKLGNYNLVSTFNCAIGFGNSPTDDAEMLRKDKPIAYGKLARAKKKELEELG